MVSDIYDESIREYSKELKKYDSLINRYSLLRLFVIILAGVVLWQTAQMQNVWVTELAFFFSFIAFIWLVKQQSVYSRKKAFCQAFIKVNQNELDSIECHSNIYDDGEEWADESHAYTSDLDIFGKASLFNLVNRCSTVPGKGALAAWLNSDAPASEVYSRQQAVEELSSATVWVKKLQASLLFALDERSSHGIPFLLKYLSGITAARSPLLKSYIRLVPWIFLSLTLASWFYTPLSLLLFVPGLINIGLVLRYSGTVSLTQQLIGRSAETLGNYSDAFLLIETQVFKSSLLNEHANLLRSAGARGFSRELKRLSKLIRQLETRLNVLVGPVLNVAMAWDVRQMLAIEDWKKENKEHVDMAFKTIALYEALISLSTLRSNYKGFCMPSIEAEGTYRVQGESIGHPLIGEKSRVLNDFSLEGKHIDIITGSNMAGKSTFLRTIGINCVLALAGAPVCASRFSVSPVKVFTYMRIKDSLNENISTFKAELNRLQFLLKVLNEQDNVYFLIDEMLRGTNSVDKYKGSKAIIEKLIRQGAVGIVATHDLQIARLEDTYPAYIRNFYFDIEVKDGEMLFDYKLKSGECKTFNASMLLRQLGVEV